jgi:uncharacterized membrane protein
MARFSFRPALTLRGRSFHGASGWDGLPTHPPLVHFPIAAYVLAAVFSVIAAIGHGTGWGHDAFVAATWLMTAGLVVSLLTALTGLLDWLTTEAGTQVRRTANAHALLMVTATVLAIVTVVLSLVGYAAGAPSALVVALAIVVAVVVAAGANLGGALVYDYGFRVVNSTSTPEWERSAVDRLPDGSPAGGGDRMTAG